MKLIIALIVGLLGFGCDDYNTEDKHDGQHYEPAPQVHVSPSPSKVILEEDDNGAKINLRIGGEVYVHLVEDPTQNLKWVISYQEREVKLSEESKKTPKPNEQTRIFKLIGMQSGRSEITFSYGTHSNEADTARKQVKYTVFVE